MRKIKFLPARKLLPGDVILHKRRRIILTEVEKLFAFVQIKAVGLVDATEARLVLHGRHKIFVMREDTHGPTTQPVSGLRDRVVLLRTERPVRVMRGDGAVWELPRIDTSGPACAGTVRLGTPSPGASPTDIPSWVGESGVPWRGTVPFVPEGWTDHQGQAAPVSSDGAGGRTAEDAVGASGMVPDLLPTIPEQRGSFLGDDRSAERSGYVRVEDILKGLHALQL